VTTIILLFLIYLGPVRFGNDA